MEWIVKWKQKCFSRTKIIPINIRTPNSRHMIHLACLYIDSVINKLPVCFVVFVCLKRLTSTFFKLVLTISNIKYQLTYIPGKCWNWWGDWGSHEPTRRFYWICQEASLEQWQVAEFMWCLEIMKSISWVDKLFFEFRKDYKTPFHPKLYLLMHL